SPIRTSAARSVGCRGGRRYHGCCRSTRRRKSTMGRFPRRPVCSEGCNLSRSSWLMGAGLLWLHLRADPALGDALRTAIHNVTGVTLPPPPPQVPTTPPPVPQPGAPPAPAPGGPPE